MRRKPLMIDHGDALRLAVALLARTLSPMPVARAPLSDAEIHGVAQALRGRLVTAVSRLAAFTEVTLERISYPRGFDEYAPLFGPAWPYHPLRHSPRIHGYRLHEPHLTKTLAEFLRPSEPQPYVRRQDE